MSLERSVLAAGMRSRYAYSRMKDYVKPVLVHPALEFLFVICGEYYERDGNVDAVDPEYLIERVKLQYQDNLKHADLYVNTIREVQAINVSAVNVAELVLEMQRRAIQPKIQMALANDESKEAKELMQEWIEIGSAQVTDDTSEMFHNFSIEDSIQSTLNPDNLIKLATRTLNDAIEGGCQPGHHIVVFAPPETGKSAMAISMMRAFAQQGLEGIYFGNEDPIRSIILRAQTALLGLTKEQIRADPRTAQKMLMARNWEALRFIPLSPGTPFEINKYVKMYKPKWVMIDQLLNLAVKADTRTNQLEAAATFARNLGIEHQCVVVSNTQAGDSATNKLVLGMGDVYQSNTGIPAQADLMIGLGMNDDYYAQDLRMINLPKNKLSGKHVFFPLRLNRQLSRYEDIVA